MLLVLCSNKDGRSIVIMQARRLWLKWESIDVSRDRSREQDANSGSLVLSLVRSSGFSSTGF